MPPSDRVSAEAETARMPAPPPAAPAGMWLELSAEQQAARREFRAFADEHVVPNAARWDRQGRIDAEVIDAVRRRGWLGALLPAAAGGGAMDPVTYGLLTEEIGRGCSSLRSLLTVHEMASVAVARWGGRELKQEVLGTLARGERIAALALTEPEAGSDAKSLLTSARQDGGEGGDWVLDGRKRWITFGMVADLFLLFARHADGLAAFLVPADAPGFARRPIPDVVGTRAAALAELELAGCRVPARYLVGRVGFGFSHVAASALDQGRYSVAWGAVGVSQACLEASREHTARRRQFGKPLAEHQLVQQKLTDMIVETRAARLLCYRAGHLRRQGDPSAAAETLLAKYYASRAAVRAALDAVQLHGAEGLSAANPLERYLRDAKVTEIIEGSTQILQSLIPRHPLPEL